MIHITALPLVSGVLAGIGVVLPGASSGDCNGNGIPDVQELATAPHLDTNQNGQPDLCEGLSVDLDRISLASGGTQTLHIELGPYTGGYLYWMLGSIAEPGEGIDLGFVNLPLAWDGPGAYMELTLNPGQDGYLQKGFGFLDANGSATARFELPPRMDPGLAGLEVRHAYLLIDTTNIIWASNSVRVRLEP